MTKRTQYFIRHCEADGCREVDRIECRSQHEYVETALIYRNRPYFCSRHQPTNLKPDSPERHVVIVCEHADVKKYPRLQDEHFWSDGSGFTYGPGFNAYAEDFPLGAKIHIRISVELPNPTPDR